VDGVAVEPRFVVVAAAAVVVVVDVEFVARCLANEEEIEQDEMAAQSCFEPDLLGLEHLLHPPQP